MFVMMIRGIFCNINFSYAQFPIASTKTEDIYPLLWRTISHLELNGLHVLGVTGDGTLVNHILFRMHSKDNLKMTHKTTNCYTDEAQHLFFFSDPPHLLKAIQNAIANPNRQLWVCQSSLTMHCIFKYFLQCWSGYQLEICKGTLRTKFGEL